MARLITAPAKFKILVANLEGSGDPSQGRNPTKLRTGFEMQVLSEVAREANESRVGDPQTPGLRSQTGLLTDTVAGVPVASTGTILVGDNDFTAPATLHLGAFTVTSDEDYDASTGTAYVGEDITVTVPDGIIVIWKTAGAGGGEGTISVPANIPMEAGGVTVHWTSGAAAQAQTANSSGVFAGNGNPAGSTINFTTGAITLDTTGAIPDALSAITIDYTAEITVGQVATALAAAINGLPQYSAAAVGATVTVTGPFGPNGNETHFEAVYTGTLENFTLTPASDFLASAEPYVGPPTILT